MPTDKLSDRDDIANEFKWRLEDIYPDLAGWEHDFIAVDSLAKELGSYQGHLGDSAAVLLAVLRLEDKLGELSEKLYTYAFMSRDQDNTNPLYQSLAERMESLNASVQATISFISPEILSFAPEILINFQNQEPELSLYKFSLTELTRQKPHILSPGEERLLARSEEMSQGAANIFKMFNNADLSFAPIQNENGDMVDLTHGRYIGFMGSKDRRVRQSSFKSMYSAYRSFRNTLAASLGATVKNDVFYAWARQYPSALSAALYSDNVPEVVYDGLIQTVRNNLGPFYRYMELRKKLLNLNELHMYDIYAPVVKNINWPFSYEEAVETICQGLSPLGKNYINTMARGIKSGWVDVYESKGKTSGAYSWGPYGVHPYVLLNYQDNLDNMFTLAHEMGHAMHSYYSYAAQPYVYAHYKTFTAEVASTVNESLLMRYLLEKETIKEKKIYLLNHYLEQFRGTVYRQTMFAEFEKIIHAQVEGGEALTTEALQDMYYKLNLDYHGPGVTVDREIDMEWARIPHFYSGFYVYQYATGFSAATAITDRILSEGEEAVKPYLHFLSRGGSDYPLNLLREAGVDMTDPQPIQECLDVFANLVDELKKLTTGS